MSENLVSGKSYIGHQLKATGNKVYKTFDPILNCDNDYQFIEATTAEVKEAVALSWKAFKVYRKLPFERRAEFLECIASEIQDLGEDLLNIYMKESGLPRGRGEGERGRTINQLKSFAAMLRDGNWMSISIDYAQPDRKPIPKQDIRKMYLPLGPVAVFGASNFPLAYSTAGGDTASAFAAGCPVIVKSHPMHAGTSELIASAIIKAAEKTSMPNGIFSHLNSSGLEIGAQLVKEPQIKAVGFTGSISGGRALFDLANARPEPIPVFAEMGSINPVIISQETLKNEGDSWASKYADSITVGAGQFCTNPGLILAIASPELDVFTKDLAAKLGKIDQFVMLHPSIKKSFDSNKKQILSQASVSQETEVLEAKINTGAQTLAKVDGAIFLANPNLHQEVFGPFSMIVACKDKEELLQVIEQLEGQLTGTIIAQDSELSPIADIIEVLQHRVGRIIFNGVPTGVEVCPSMNHGGPYPASTDSRFTAVGTDSINRWLRPISYQNFPSILLPKSLVNV